MTHTIKFIFGSIPKDGGTFTFYRTLRPQLIDYGINMRCVSVGKGEANLWDDDFADEGCFCLAEKTGNVKGQAMIFVDWCKDHGVDIVMGINSVAILSALPHLPGNIRVMSRCANSFDHGYRITVSCYERLAGIIAQTPRQIHDLSKNYGVAKDRLSLIHNGIEIVKFQDAASRPRGESSALRIGFLGRLEHNQKGVLFLPGIIRKLYEQKKISAAEFQHKVNDYLQTKNKFDTMQNELSLQKSELEIERNELHNLVGNELLYRENPTLLAFDYRMKLEEISGKLDQLKWKETALIVTTARKGIITKLNFQNGEFVSSGSIIAEISNPDSIFIIAFGNVLTHKKIFVGRKVIIYGSDGAKLDGIVKSVSPLVKPVKAFSSAFGEKSLYDEIEISPNNAREARKHLIPGEKISVRIML